MNTQQNLNSPDFQHSNLPNATACLVLGILSLVCSCFGVGIICGMIGLVLAGKDVKLYHATPELYSASSYGYLNAGRICSIIGIITGGLFLLLVGWNYFRTISQ